MVNEKPIVRLIETVSIRDTLNPETSMVMNLV